MIFECPCCKFMIDTDEQFIFDVMEVVTLSCKNCGSVLHGVAERNPNATHWTKWNFECVSRRSERTGTDLSDQPISKG